MSEKKLLRKKRHVLRRQRYQLKRSGWKKRRVRQRRRRASTSIYQKRETVTLKAPTIFNLRYENCVQVIKYISLIKKTASKNNDIIVDLTNVKDIREGAIAMLLSVMREVTHSYGVFINGTFPTDETAKITLEQSGFLKFVRRNEVIPSVPEHKNRMHTGYRNMKAGFVPDDIKSAMATVWGKAGRNPLLRGAIFEMMRNSVDHAFHKREKIRWHLSISHDEENHLVKFSFVDNGRGIIESMRKAKLKLYFHRFVDGADVLDTAFKDGMASRTGLSWRGQGLPFIYENYEEGIVKNFLVISNNVFIHYDSGIKTLLPVSFSGTYYYWEIDQTCKKAVFE